MAVTVTYRVPNMSCNHCVHTIERELQGVQGVLQVKADLATKQVTITFDAPATEEVLKRTLADIDYPVVED